MDLLRVEAASHACALRKLQNSEFFLKVERATRLSLEKRVYDMDREMRRDKRQSNVRIMHELLFPCRRERAMQTE